MLKEIKTRDQAAAGWEPVGAIQVRENNGCDWGFISGDGRKCTFRGAFGRGISKTLWLIGKDELQNQRLLPKLWFKPLVYLLNYGNLQQDPVL